MKVLKFGGSSVATPERINQLIDLVEPRIQSGEALTIVCSAFGGVTDMLIEMSDLAARGKEKYIGLYHQFTDRHQQAVGSLLSGDALLSAQEEINKNHQTLKELLRGIFLVREASPRTMDYVLSFGERSSNFIIAHAMRARGLDADYLDARNIIKTNKEFGNAKVKFGLTYDKISEHFSTVKGRTQVVTGFIATATGGLTTTLGRGGSDYTAAILAGALNAEILEIWTDVDGVLTSDPRKVKKAFSLPQLSYAEAMEMSHFGAKVIYPPTIQPALEADIPIYIKNTLNPTHPGTRIHNAYDEEWRSPIKGISSLKDVVLLSLEGSGMMGVPGISSRLFTSLANKEINVILITQASSEHSICIAVAKKDAEEAKEAIDKAFEQEILGHKIDPVKIEDDLCIMAVIGEKMRAVPGIAGKLFQALGRNGINVIAIAQGSSELNISFVIDQKDEAKCLNLVHDAFFLSESKTIHLFMIGVGLIGGTLLQQINDQKKILRDRYAIDIAVCGIANSKKMLFNNDGIDLESWKEQLDASDHVSDPEDFLKEMIDMNLSNSIFIDNTANKSIPDLYESILDANISITTPNKVATSSSYESYLNLKNKARDKGVYFLYETNVGAGLPILSTMKNLINSGDSILKIEAVVSGSLSFIFNSFDGSVPFSSLVAKAKEKGFTEPDPREDLSGQDVKRKIIILTREAGFHIEPENVILDPILPEELMAVEGVDAFFNKLEEYDGAFKEKVEEAKAEGKVWRFIAETKNGNAKIGLKKVGPDSPFHGLSGADNMVVITTERYHTRPLVVKGPGAGAEVTAGGVFADLLTIVNIG